jgi:hypothetical protein
VDFDDHGLKSDFWHSSFLCSDVPGHLKEVSREMSEGMEREVEGNWG